MPIMSASKLIVVSEASDVRQSLGALGLTVEFVTEVARRAAAAKAESLPVDPCSTPGTFSYIYGVRAIRLALIPMGWEMSRAGNVESTVNHDLGIQLVFQNVDSACESRDPQPISGKGGGSRKLVEFGQQIEIFATPATGGKRDARGAVPTVWLICVSTDENKLRAEVSCPEAFEGSQFEGFSKRIFVVDEGLDPEVRHDYVPDEGSGTDEFEVRVAKK